MTKHPGSRAELKGHAASTPGATKQRLDRLSRARAQRVAAVFAAAGINPASLSVKGVGDREPLGEDIDPSTGKQIPAAAARERRVDVTIKEAGTCSQ